MKQPIYNQQGRTACVLHFNADKLTSEVSKSFSCCQNNCEIWAVMWSTANTQSCSLSCWSHIFYPLFLSTADQRSDDRKRSLSRGCSLLNEPSYWLFLPVAHRRWFESCWHWDGPFAEVLQVDVISMWTECECYECGSLSLVTLDEPAQSGCCCPLTNRRSVLRVMQVIYVT